MSNAHSDWRPSIASGWPAVVLQTIPALTATHKYRFAGHTRRAAGPRAGTVAARTDQNTQTRTKTQPSSLPKCSTPWSRRGPSTSWRRAFLAVLKRIRCRSSRYCAPCPTSTVTRVGTATLLGNWNVLGVRGTGSYDFRVREPIIQADFAFDPATAQPQRGGALYRMGFMAIALPCHSGFGLGRTRRMLDEWVASRATSSASRRHDQRNGNLLEGPGGCTRTPVLRQCLCAHDVREDLRGGRARQHPWRSRAGWPVVRRPHHLNRRAACPTRVHLERNHCACATAARFSATSAICKLAMRIS